MGKGQTSRSEISRHRPERPQSRQEVAACFVRHGYVVVYQDCRGRYGSEGAFEKYLAEATDGDHTCARGPLAQQSLVQWPHRNHGVVLCRPYPDGTRQPQSRLAWRPWLWDSGGFSNAYQSGIRQGGAFELRQATWAYTNALKSPSVLADPQRRATLEAVDLHQWFARMPWQPGHSPVTAAPEYEAYLFEQWTHGTFDDYGGATVLYAAGYYAQSADAAQVHMSSRAHPDVRTATDNYQGLVTCKRGPVAAHPRSLDARQPFIELCRGG